MVGLLDVRPRSLQCSCLKSSAGGSPSRVADWYCFVLFLSVLDPRVGHTMEIHEIYEIQLPKYRNPRKKYEIHCLKVEIHEIHIATTSSNFDRVVNVQGLPCHWNGCFDRPTYAGWAGV